MRIAASVAQGLAHGAGLKIVPVSSLAAVAAQVLEVSDADIVAVAQDAHMNEVYLGIFARGDNDLPLLLGDERLHAHEAVVELEENDMTRRIAAGYGWRRYPKLMNINSELFAQESAILYPHARYLLALAGNADAVAPQDIMPAYLRNEVAKKSGTLKQ
jgi:tRNA threonylcarbamoyladenosine biosynthesis protein TsaB